MNAVFLAVFRVIAAPLPKKAERQSRPTAIRRGVGGTPPFERVAIAIQVQEDTQQIPKIFAYPASACIRAPLAASRIRSGGLP